MPKSSRLPRSARIGGRKEVAVTKKPRKPKKPKDIDSVVATGFIHYAVSGWDLTDKPFADIEGQITDPKDCRRMAKWLLDFAAWVESGASHEETP